MRRVLAFIVLLSHMNTSMLLPQCAIPDVYDSNGNQIDDITSIVELIRVDLGYDHHADDENDDSGQSFHVARCEFVIQPFFQEPNQDFKIKPIEQFFDHSDQRTIAASYDIIVPPPKGIATC